MEQSGAEGGQSVLVGFASAGLCLAQVFIYFACFPSF